MILCAFGVLGSVLWLRGALAQGALDRTVVCFDARSIVRAKAGLTSQWDRDRLVTTTIQFNTQTSPGLSLWHVRGAAIMLTYRTFWPVAARNALYERLAAHTRTCPSVNGKRLAEARQFVARWRRLR